jgi:phage N-6-adenine-methyltransferase
LSPSLKTTHKTALFFWGVSSLFTMSLIGFKARNHPKHVGPRGIGRMDLLPGLGEHFAADPADVTDEVDDRAVPEAVFAEWHSRFNFTVDVAANHHNAKLPRYYTRENSGLEASWADERVYCNCPFSNIAPWVEKAWAEINAQLVVMLLPANRTEQKWWQKLVEPFRDRSESFRSEFLPDRLKFLSPGEDEIRANNRPPFGCCMLIWTRSP